MNQPDHQADPPNSPKERLAHVVKNNKTLKRKLASSKELARRLRLHQFELEAQNRALQETQAQLEAASHRYGELFETAPVGYFILDAQGIICRANEVGRQMLGATKASLRGDALITYLRKDCRATVSAMLRQGAVGEGASSVELACWNARGSAKPIKAVCVAERDIAGALTGYKVSLVDICPQKELENHLRLLARVGETLVSSLLYRDTIAAVLAQISEEFAAHCFLDFEEDGKLIRLAAPADRQDYATVYPLNCANGPQAHVMRSGQPLATSAERMREEKVSPLGSIVVAPVIIRGETVGALTVIGRVGEKAYDKTDLHTVVEVAHRMAMAIDNGRSHVKANRAVRAREVLLAMVSHDLKNILSSITLRSEVFRNAVAQGNTDQSQRHGSAIAAHAMRMNRLVEDLLDISSIETGHLSIKPSTIDSIALVTDCLEASSVLAQNRQVSLVAGCVEAMALQCDRDRIAQVFANLLSNAIKFSPAGGQVVVEAWKRPDDALFRVTDTGPGMHADEAAHVFDCFWRGATEGRSAGHGLGLAIVKGIIDASGGRVWVESRPRVGTRFLFTLPLATC